MSLYMKTTACLGVLSVKATDELILKALGIEKGSDKSKINTLETKLTQAQLTEIAQKRWLTPIRII